MLQKAPSALVNPNPTVGLRSTAKLHLFPEIVREDLRARAFNRETSAGPTHEFEDPASKATPDAENLANLGDAVLRLIVAGLVSEMYPGLQAAPAVKLRDSLLDDENLDDLCEKSQYLNRVNGSFAPTRGIQKRDIFKAFIGAIQLEQGFESAKRLLDAPFRDYSTSAYNLLRESYGYASKQISVHIGAPSMPQPQPPPSSSSPDSSTNHLVLLNESLKKSNRQASWVCADYLSVGVDAGSNGNSPAPGSPPRGSKGDAQKWSVEALSRLA
ncbi:hypothetical protein B0H14DRAFT_3853070 [Mycena olivaceomarginata]|nr:hypothetical protein B0H14DRAFT_3853070 [Mycena olivaceomarginata]